MGCILGITGDLCLQEIPREDYGPIRTCIRAHRVHRQTYLTFFKTFIAKIFPALVPCTFRTWNTYNEMEDEIRLRIPWKIGEAQEAPPTDTHFLANQDSKGMR